MEALSAGQRGIRAVCKGLTALIISVFIVTPSPSGRAQPPDYLAPSDLDVPDWGPQYLPEWRPFDTSLRFALHGDYQIFQVLKKSDSRQPGLARVQHTLTFEPDVLLTSTLRLHARWRPLKDATFLLDDDIKLNDDTVERAFFEGRALGLDVSGGRIPLLFHNLYMAEDDVVGGLVAKNNLVLFDLPNIRLLLFATASGGFSELERFEGQQVGLYGIDAVIDTARYTIEATFGYLHNEDFKHRDERHAGLSFISFGHRQSFALRAFGSWIQNNEDPGALVIVEHSYMFPATILERPTWYANFFYGTRDFRTMANGSLKNLGFLFNQLNGMPQLANAGIDSFGFAVGLLLGRSREFTVTPELSTVFDQSRRDNDQLAGGFRVQGRLLKTSFWRVDLVALRQSVDDTPTQLATSILVVYRF